MYIDHEISSIQQSFEASDSTLNIKGSAKFYTAHYDEEKLSLEHLKFNKNNNEFVSSSKQI